MAKSRGVIADVRRTIDYWMGLFPPPCDLDPPLWPQEAMRELGVKNPPVTTTWTEVEVTAQMKWADMRRRARAKHGNGGLAAGPDKTEPLHRSGSAASDNGLG